MYIIKKNKSGMNWRHFDRSAFHYCGWRCIWSTGAAPPFSMIHAQSKSSNGNQVIPVFPMIQRRIILFISIFTYSECVFEAWLGLHNWAMIKIDFTSIFDLYILLFSVMCCALCHAHCHALSMVDRTSLISPQQNANWRVMCRHWS